tara:strand:+ start:3694 stop:4812 length:1119 start_codon:yes stop_codon:yes gene_type:complete
VKDSLKIGIIAGEHSGDILGENLLKALKKIKNVEIFGVGGPKMESQGLKSLFDFNNLNIMGFVDPIINYSKISAYKNDVCKLFIAKKIDIFIGIDSPDFNMQIQKKLKKKTNIKTVQLVTPSIWAWRKGRLKNIKKYTDLSISLFKFEHDFYKKNKLHNLFLGHHYADLEKSDIPNILKKYDFDEESKFVSILPGSRNSEIKNMMPTYLEFMQLYEITNKKVIFLIPAVNDKDAKLIESYLEKETIDYRVGVNAANDFLSLSEFSVVTSGTASLQSSVLGSHPVICYKTSFLNYFVISRMIQTEIIGLPNLLLSEKVFPELLQKTCTPQRILLEIQKLKINKLLLDQKTDLIKKNLRGIGFDSVAEEVINIQ